MKQIDEIGFVISSLAKYRTRDDIIWDLCEQSGYNWEEAAALVRRVESEQIQRIQARRRGALMLFGVLFVISGLGPIVYGLYSLLSGEKLALGISLPFIEIYLPYGGQIVFVLWGLPILLGGAIGIWLASQRRDGAALDN